MGGRYAPHKEWCYSGLRILHKHKHVRVGVTKHYLNALCNYEGDGNHFAPNFYDPSAILVSIPKSKSEGPERNKKNEKKCEKISKGKILPYKITIS